MYWPENDQYHPGMIHSAASDGRLNVQYDDGEKECLDLNTQTWKFPSASSVNSAQHPTVTELSSTESIVLAVMAKHFGNKSFMKHQAQGFDHFRLFNAHKREQGTFLKPVRPVPRKKSQPDPTSLGVQTSTR